MPVHIKLLGAEVKEYAVVSRVRFISHFTLSDNSEITVCAAVPHTYIHTKCC